MHFSFLTCVKHAWLSESWLLSSCKLRCGCKGRGFVAWPAASPVQRLSTGPRSLLLRHDCLSIWQCSRTIAGWLRQHAAARRITGGLHRAVTKPHARICRRTRSCCSSAASSARLASATPEKVWEYIIDFVETIQTAQCELPFDKAQKISLTTAEEVFKANEQRAQQSRSPAYMPAKAKPCAVFSPGGSSRELPLSPAKIDRNKQNREEACTRKDTKSNTTALRRQMRRLPC